MATAFIKYLGTSHIAALNLALYSSGAVRVENIVNHKSLGARQFDSPQAAQDWFDALADTEPTDNMTRLTRGISSIAPSVQFPR